MKFPYELSEQRISLLSKEDQRLYRFEHSDFFDYAEKQRCMQEYQNALLERQGYYVQEIKKDPQFNTLNESEVFETAKELTLYENGVLLDQLQEIVEEALLTNSLSEAEITEALNATADHMNYLAEASLNEGSLNEESGGTIGPDMTYWANGLGGLFSGFFGIILALMMRGKTKMAIRQLENYMNKIVETVDDGINKKKGRGLWARLKTGIGKLFGRDTSNKNQGEQNTMCLRVLQETFSADIGTKSMVFCKHLGLLPDDWNGALAALQASDFTRGSYGEFVEKIAKPVADLGNVKNKE